MNQKKSKLSEIALGTIAGSLLYVATVPVINKFMEKNNAQYETQKTLEQVAIPEIGEELTPQEIILRVIQEPPILSVKPLKKPHKKPTISRGKLKEEIANYIEEQPKFWNANPRSNYNPNKILEEGSAKASFYRPAEPSGLGGPDITATGLTISKAVSEGIPIVAGSCRLGIEFGNALYELTNPRSGKSAIVYVADKFAESTLRNHPERYFDIVSNSNIPEQLGFSGDPEDPDSFAVQSVDFKYLGKIFNP
jgi:hypothetical protein